MEWLIYARASRAMAPANANAMGLFVAAEPLTWRGAEGVEDGGGAGIVAFIVVGAAMGIVVGGAGASVMVEGAVVTLDRIVVGNVS
jgi:hypothetical protein